MEQIFTDASVRRDGVRVVTRRTTAPSGAGGGVQWEADVLHPGGLRISVSTLNSTAFGLPPTRKTPSPTVGQLIAIASDAAWESQSGVSLRIGLRRGVGDAGEGREALGAALVTIRFPVP
ncbi:MULTISPECIES: hypothetical protein [Streptomyces]|uniref:hypothetical protein n=1 Tax=Streptomyces TaxID=1883 RepID=UPI00240D6743|nr:MULTISPECIES: hypothetical protein [Streptomyces]WFB88569.1 hypothetical protein MMU79_37695 [Streptomyces olivaceus]WGK50710.1 hypothetical protein M6G09_36720 [Streptomyces sp. B146]